MIQRKELASVLPRYQDWLVEQERSVHTVGKYLRDVRQFLAFLEENHSQQVSKQEVIAYKQQLQKKHRVSSVNSILAAVNGFLRFAGCDECRVKLVRCQRQPFMDDSRELTKEEYFRLLHAARRKHNQRLCLVMETICATGIRVSELPYITVEAVRARRAEITCKGKRRTVILPKKLCSALARYAGSCGIQKGYLFRTASGKPLDRSNIWHAMKRLGREAGVAESKIFPHNLRHLFARTFYGLEKDIVRLADILGHSSINTTRIYTAVSRNEYASKVERLGLVV